LALSQEKHQNDLLDALRKTVKQLVSEYHTTETPIVLGNASIQRLITVLSVIFKHGITGTTEYLTLSHSVVTPFHSTVRALFDPLLTLFHIFWFLKIDLMATWSIFTVW